MAMSYSEWNRTIGGTRERYQDYLRGLAESARLANEPPAAAGGGYLSKTEFESIREFRAGGIPVTLARLTREYANSPVVFAAALSEDDLRRESCGYGVTESEATADLFRLMRP